MSYLGSHIGHLGAVLIPDIFHEQQKQSQANKDGQNFESNESIFHSHP